MKYLLNIFLVSQVVGGCPAVCWKVWSLLSIVNADFNNGVKAEEVMVEILAKDDSSRFWVAQSSLRD